MFDDRPDLSHPDELPLATAAELRAWRIVIPDVDLNIQVSDAWLMVPWVKAARLASITLHELGLTTEERHALFAFSDPIHTEAQRQAYRARVRPMVYDVLRCFLAIRVLYRGDQQAARAGFEAAHPHLNHRSPKEELLTAGAANLRRLLEQRLEARG